MEKDDEILNILKKLSVLEIEYLLKTIEEIYGVKVCIKTLINKEKI
jgi:ribosomal protein L7/L12